LKSLIDWIEMHLLQLQLFMDVAKQEKNSVFPPRHFIFLLSVTFQQKKFAGLPNGIFVYQKSHSWYNLTGLAHRSNGILPK
jgi:hypothetical protein